MRISLINFKIEPKRNCPPNARHSAGNIEAGFFSFSGLKLTLAEVFRYVALVPFDLNVTNKQTYIELFGLYNRFRIL